jgi:acyl-CoA thioester hydrolase
METPHTLVFTTHIPIRWGDLDAFKHVNNTIYFRYMEQARVEWLEALDIPVEIAQDEGVILVNASCTFLRPLTYPGTVECRVFVGPPGRSSLPTFYQMRRVGEEILYAEGASKIVWINNSTGKSTPLPEKLRSLFNDCA